jgi:hypothetical protein
LPDGVQGRFVADDVFVIVALPDGCAGGAAQAVDSPGRDGFEVGDDGAQGSGWGAGGMVWWGRGIPGKGLVDGGGCGGRDVVRWPIGCLGRGIPGQGLLDGVGSGRRNVVGWPIGCRGCLAPTARPTALLSAQPANRACVSTILAVYNTPSSVASHPVQFHRRRCA